MFARTDRLLLRPGFAEDARALALALGDDRVTRNLSHLPHPYGMADAQDWLGLEHPPLLPHMLMARRTQGVPDIIGGIGFNAIADGQIEIGYWVRRDCWGLGYASEAGRAAMAMAPQPTRVRSPAEAAKRVQSLRGVDGWRVIGEPWKETASYHILALGGRSSFSWRERRLICASRTWAWERSGAGS